MMIETGKNLLVAKRTDVNDRTWNDAELSPEGLCGLGPLHLPQASGFAGGC